MNHTEYIERYLELDDDDEVSAQERLSISTHVANCKECQAYLANEHATRTMLKENIRVIRAPETLRQRIAASLDAIDRSESKRGRLRNIGRRPRWVAGFSLAACLTLLVLNLRARSVDNPVFDGAIASYVASQKHFVATFGTKSTDDLAIAMIDQFGVPLVWDFSSAGLTSRGGRVDKGANGHIVAYSWYDGDRGSLLCVIDRPEGFHFPPGDKVVKGIHLYRYKGYTIAATDRYSVFCVMISDLPVAELARAFDRLPA
jgi:hypothetical protein